LPSCLGPRLTPQSRELTRNERTYRSQPSGARNQAQALEAEGVTVGRSAMGELTVDFAEHGWFPRSLPSAGSEGEDSEYDSQNGT